MGGQEEKMAALSGMASLDACFPRRNHAFPGCMSFPTMVCCGTERGQNMATAIKAIPTLKGREAKEFLRHAAAVERRCTKVPNRNGHPSCRLAHAILDKAGMLK